MDERERIKRTTNTDSTAFLIHKILKHKIRMDERERKVQ